mmetsp:Transcript_22001/g.55471  ORF Transcript_22001/g.55471 Transcript_22001/m.55471 type:complete len:346 (-) Transcript_22001:1273-2310(-)
MSPARFTNASPSLAEEICHLPFSPPRPEISFSARASRVLQSVTCCASSADFFLDAASPSSSACSLSSTSFNSAFFSASLSWACFNFACDAASASLFGPTSRATRSYTIMARTHLHIPAAATEDFFTASGSKFGSASNGFTLAITDSAMLSLSYSIIRFSRFVSPYSFFLAGSQKSSTFLFPPAGSFTFTGSTPNMMHNACDVKITPGGGDFIAFTSTMSPLDKEFNAETAACSAGSASSRSFWQSRAMVSASAEMMFASFSSFSIRPLVTAASLEDFSITTICSWFSFVIFTSTGCKSSSSFCMSVTMISVDIILSRPTSYRDFAEETSFFFFPRSAMKQFTSSR